MTSHRFFLVFFFHHGPFTRWIQNTRWFVYQYKNKKTHTPLYILCLSHHVSVVSKCRFSIVDCFLTPWDIIDYFHYTLENCFVLNDCSLFHVLTVSCLTYTVRHIQHTSFRSICSFVVLYLSIFFPIASNRRLWVYLHPHETVSVSDTIDLFHGVIWISPVSSYYRWSTWSCWIVPYTWHCHRVTSVVFDLYVRHDPVILIGILHPDEQYLWFPNHWSDTGSYT